jgi:MoxR-like ATPase
MTAPAANAAAVTAVPASVDATLALLQAHDYIAPRDLATAVFLSLAMPRPLFLEGEAGVGKTEIAKVLAKALHRRLVRLQCYEGLDIASAAYEWNYQRQMVEIRLREAQDSGSSGADQLARDRFTEGLFSERFLLRRPLLDAIAPQDGVAPVLLIDELDRTDEPFEAYLLEVLSDWQITIPELGTLRAQQPPIVIITSNRTREIHDAVKRRCIYHWVDYPDFARELEIVQRRAPHTAQNLAREVVAFVQRARKLDLFKAPGVAETLDWANALGMLGAQKLEAQQVDATLGVLLKYQDDIAKVRGATAAQLLSEVRA